MKLRKINRRRFLFAGLILTPAIVAADSCWIEPHWLKTKTLRLTQDKPAHRLVHFTDLHYKGDRAYGESLVKAIDVTLLFQAT